MAQISSFSGNTLTPRPFCDLAFLSPGAEQGYYARTLSTARQLDELSERFEAARENGSVEVAREVLEDKRFLSPSGSLTLMRIPTLSRNLRLGARFLPPRVGKRWKCRCGSSLAVRCLTGWRAGMSTST